MMKDWVTDRFEYDVKVAFSDLRKLVGQYVDKMNKLMNPTGSIGFRKSFEVSPKDKESRFTEVQLYLNGSPENLYHISLEDRHIAIKPAGDAKPILTIQPFWDRENAQWRLSIQYSDFTKNDRFIKPDDLWIVVQDFLEPVFFPEREKGD